MPHINTLTKVINKIAELLTVKHSLGKEKMIINQKNILLHSEKRNYKLWERL